VTTVFDTEFTHYTTALFGAPFFTGTSASSPEVPHKYDVALDGRVFMLDGEPLWRTIPTLRTQNDDREAGELSLNPEGLWRRSSSSWEFGAGQEMYDDENAQRQRFRSSKGVDVWTPGKLTLLPDTTLQTSVSASATTVPIVSTAAHVYWADLNTVVRSDLTTETNVTGTPATAITSMVSVGSYVLVAYTGNGVYKIAAGATTGAAWMTDAVTPSLVGWAKGRVIICVGAAVYNPTTAFSGSAALPTALFTHPDSAFSWVGVADGTSFIYLGGTSGDKSTIYKTAVKADGTALDIPSVAGRLLDGETLTSIYGYHGVLILGTTEGFHIAAPNQAGDLTIGALVDLDVAVKTMFGRGNFVYFGWSNYDATSTGLGRMDLHTLTDGDNLVPAYASDLMATTQGTVAGIAYLGRLVFGINAVGVYKQAATDLVASGTISSGIIRYGLTEEKVVTGARAGFTGDGTVSLELAVDGGTFASIGASGAQERGVNFELRTTVTQAGGDVSPVLESITLYSYPAPQGTLMIDLPLLIAEEIETRQGGHEHMDIVSTLEFLQDRFLSKVLITIQVGKSVYQGTLEQYRFQGSNPAEEQVGAWCGTAPASVKVVS
jgi:hypothetical protein